VTNLRTNLSKGKVSVNKLPDKLALPSLSQVINQGKFRKKNWKLSP